MPVPCVVWSCDGESFYDDVPACDGLSFYDGLSSYDVQGISYGSYDDGESFYVVRVPDDALWFSFYVWFFFVPFYCLFLFFWS